MAELALFAKIQEIIAYAAEHSSAFQKRLADAGLSTNDFDSFDDLEKLPVLRKDSLIDLQASAPPFGGLLGIDIQQLQHIFQSPGPIYDPHGATEDYWRFGEALKTAGFGKGDVVINTFSYHLSPAGFMFDDGARSVGAVVVPAGTGNAELQVRIMNDLPVTAYMGTPSYLVALLKKAAEMQVPLFLKKAMLTAEPFLPAQRERFRQAGIDAYQVYGTADAGALAYESEMRVGLRICDDIYLEIVDPASGKVVEDGAIGEVVVTLFDKTYPLIRFGTGDLSKRITEPRPSGRKGGYIAGFMGRIGEGVKVRGMFVHPRQINELVNAFTEVERIVVEVSHRDERDYMTLLVQTAGLTSQTELSDRIQEKTRSILRLKADAVSFTPLADTDSAKSIVDLRSS